MSNPNQNPNPNIANRKILTPRRRLLNRTASDMGSNPMQNFNFVPQTSLQAPGFGQAGQSQSQNAFNTSGSAGSDQANQFNTKNATSQPVFGFGASQGQSTSPTSGPFQFGGSSTQQPAPFTFGSGNAPTTATSSQPAFTFGSQNSSSSTGSTSATSQPFSFGASVSGTRTQAASPFGGFGASEPAPAPASVTPQSPSATGFSFGAPTQSPPVSPAFSFGQQNASTAAPASGGFTFNLTAPATSQASPSISGGQPSTPPPQQTGFTFGAPSVVSAAPSTPPMSGFTFGSAAPSSVKPAFGFPTPAPSALTESSEDKNGDSAMVTETESEGDKSATAVVKPKESVDVQQNVTKVPSFFGTASTKENEPKVTTEATAKKDNTVKQPAFSFGVPTTPTTTITTTTTTTPAIMFGTPQTKSKEEDKPKQPSFSFGAAQATSTKEDDKPKQPTFSFGTSQATTAKEDEKSKQPAFTFNSSLATVTKEDDKSKLPSFTFGGPQTNGEKEPEKTKEPSFTFGIPQASASKEDNTPKTAGFTFGATQTAAEKEPEKPKEPTFTFGASATSKSSEKPLPAITFDKPQSSQEDGQQTKPSFSFGSSTSSKGEQPSKPLFSFSTPTPAKEGEEHTGQKTTTEQPETPAQKEGLKDSVETSSSWLGFSVPSSSTVQSEDGSPSANSTNNKRKAMDSASSPEPRSKLLHGKSPLSQSWHAEDGEASKTDTSSNKRSAPAVSEPPTAVKPAATTDVPKRKKTSMEDKDTKSINPFTALDSTPIDVTNLQTKTTPPKPRSTSADVFGKPATVETEQTMIDSSITGPETIAKRTRYAELPLEAQAEIDSLWQLISQQTSACRTIQAKQLASNGEMIEDISRYAKRMTLDVRLTKEQHQTTLKNVIRLRDNVEHELTNALVAKVYHETEDSRKWMTGQTATRQYFVDLISGMQARCNKYREAIKEIEDHMKHLDQDYPHLTPGSIPRILKEQHQVLLSLAAKVSNLHDETQKLVSDNKNGVSA